MLLHSQKDGLYLPYMIKLMKIDEQSNLLYNCGLDAAPERQNCHVHRLKNFRILHNLKSTEGHDIKPL